jgi:hypothetical protein
MTHKMTRNKTRIRNTLLLSRKMIHGVVTIAALTP